MSEQGFSRDKFVNDISQLEEKTSPVAADLVLIEDSAASQINKKVQIGNLPVSNYSPLSCYIDKKERNTVYNINGGINSLATAETLDATSPTGPISVTAGVGKLIFVLIAGSDVSGSFTVTGTSVDRETGTETPSDTDVITVDTLSTDGSDTDAAGNTRYSFTNAYMTSKWFKGAITVTTSDLTLTDVDVYQCSFEQYNDAASYQLDTFDINALCTNTAGWFYAYLYSVVPSGDKVSLTREASVAVDVGDSEADKYYRLRVGNIAKDMDGSSDGIFVQMFPGPLANQYWEDINVKVWAIMDTSGGIPVFGSDADAIHDNVAGEIAAIAFKGTVSYPDLVLLEDSDDSNNKKRTTLTRLLDLMPYHAYDNTGGQTISTTATRVNIDTEDIANSNYSLSGDRITVSRAGVYMLSFQVTIDESANVTSVRGGFRVTPYVNGVADNSRVAWNYWRELAPTYNSVGRTVPIQLSASDIVDIYMQLDAGLTAPFTTLAKGSSISLHWLSNG